MSTRATSWLAWSLAGLSVAMFLASVVLHVLAFSSQEATSTGDTLGDLFICLAFLAFPIVGALVTSRHPQNSVGWICLAVGLFWMLNFLGDSMPGSGPYPVTTDALTQATWVPSVGLLGIYLILLFPDGKPPSRRWRPLAWLSGVVMVLASLAITFYPGPLEGHPGVRNPIGLEGAPWVATAGIAIVLLLPLCMLASALSLVLRYRRSGGEERQQIKWIAYAAAFVGMMYLIAMVLSFVHPGEAWFAPGSSRPPWLGILQYAAIISFTTIPLAVGFAVLKYRLYDIEVIINRTLVYGSLTAAMAAIYEITLVTLQHVLLALTHVEDSQLAYFATAMVMAAVFEPLKRRIDAFVERYLLEGDARAGP